jgi:phage shock protein PspC (stress-responsive transcriptional regulator)
MKENTPARRLTRSRDDRFIGGVAAGIGRFLNVDPAIVRIGFVISIIFGGVGALAYLILLAAIPIDGDPNEPTPKLEGSRRKWVIGGTVALGVLTLLSIRGVGIGGWLFGFAEGFWFGALIWAIAIGGVIWSLRQARSEDENPEKVPADPAKAAAAVTTVMAPAPTQNAPATAETETLETEILAAAPTQDAPRRKAGPDPALASPRQPREEGRVTIGKVMTVIAIVLAGLFSAVVLATISGWSTAVFGAAPMAFVVILLGIGLVVAALKDRHSIALWTLGAAVAIAIPMAAVSIANLGIEGDYGEVREAPMVADAIPGDGYQLAAGAMTIDMRNYPFRDGVTVDLPIDSGLGASRVIVPDDVCVTGSVEGKAGIAEVRGLESSGVGFDRSFGGGNGKVPVLNIDTDLKIGLFEVIDNTTWLGSGSRGSRNDDSWGANIDNPKRQDAAQKRALAACDAATRKPAPDKPKAPSAPSEKAAA